MLRQMDLSPLTSADTPQVMRIERLPGRMRGRQSWTPQPGSRYQRLT
ncbi:MAG TPA: hypothetical protein VF474_10300 [Phenylobacterium sp.]